MISQGHLIIRPKNASLDRSTEFLGKMDVVCRLTLGTQEQETKKHTKGGKNPHWDDTLTMIRVDEPSIVVTLVDIDKFKTDLIGQTTIQLHSILLQMKVEAWYELFYKEKVVGEVLLEFEWHPPGDQQTLES